MITFLGTTWVEATRDIPQMTFSLSLGPNKKPSIWLLYLDLGNAYSTSGSITSSLKESIFEWEPK